MLIRHKKNCLNLSPLSVAVEDTGNGNFWYLYLWIMSNILNQFQIRAQENKVLCATKRSNAHSFNILLNPIQ